MLVNIKVTGGLNIESGQIDPKATGGLIHQDLVFCVLIRVVEDFLCQGGPKMCFQSNYGVLKSFGQCCYLNIHGAYPPIPEAHTTSQLHHSIGCTESFIADLRPEDREADMNSAERGCCIQVSNFLAVHTSPF